jgi:eukaryotic-like serine/threonine-protein kinase
MEIQPQSGGSGGRTGGTPLVACGYGDGHDGRYTNLREPVSNILGVAYRGLDPLLDRPVLVIDIHQRIIEEDQVRERLLRESQNWACVRLHPNVVALYDLMIKDDHVYLVLGDHSAITLEQYLTGRSLRMAEEQAVRIFKQICDALEHIHGHGISHRQINTDTIVVDPNDDASIWGTGVAFLAYQGFEPKELIGACLFNSPEQIRGEWASVESEIYSLGVVLYRMLTGRIPFTSDCLASLAEQIVNVDPTPPVEFSPSVSKVLNGIVLKCLEKKPVDRFRTVAELRAALP